MFSNRLIFVAIVLLGSCAPKEQKQNDVRAFFVQDKPLVLNGDVKQVFVTCEDTNDKLLNDGDFTQVNFDKKGDVIEIASSFHGTTLPIKYNTKHGGNNRKLETIGYMTIPKKNFIFSKDHIIADSERFAKHDSVDIIFQIYKYNEDNFIAELIPEPGMSSIFKFLYDDVGDMIEYDEYLSPNDLFKKTIYNYDNQHHLIKSYSLTNNIHLVEITYEYKSFDSHNNWIKAIAHSSALHGSEKKSIIITRKISYY
jgi:hypothetical protein